MNVAMSSDMCTQHRARGHCQTGNCAFLHCAEDASLKMSMPAVGLLMPVRGACRCQSLCVRSFQMKPGNLGLSLLAGDKATRQRVPLHV